MALSRILDCPPACPSVRPFLLCDSSHGTDQSTHRPTHPPCNRLPRRSVTVLQLQQLLLLLLASGHAAAAAATAARCRHASEARRRRHSFTSGLLAASCCSCCFVYQTHRWLVNDKHRKPRISAASVLHAVRRLLMIILILLGLP